MLRNYLRIALRNFLRNKVFSFINLFGLVLGLTSALVIYLYAKHELTYDHFHDKTGRLYRLTYDEREANPQDGRFLATTSPPTGSALVAAYPEIEKYVRIRYSNNDLIENETSKHYENNLIYADADFFELFSFDLISGNPATALRDPDCVVLTEAMAHKYFGETNPIGKTLRLNAENTLKITGILAPNYEPSHLQFDFLVSFSTFRVPTGYPVTLQSWRWISFHTYLLLAEGADPKALEKQFSDFIKKHIPESDFKFGLQPVEDIYLEKPYSRDLASGNRSFVYGLIGVGCLILLLASFNYINLATARSLRRGLEVGIRKVMGASRTEILKQFLGEAIFLTLVSLMISVFLIESVLRLINPMIGIQLHLTIPLFVELLLMGGVFSVAVGILAGFYPALVMSRFLPVETLKGKFQFSASGLNLRKTLLILQFTLTIVLTGSVVVIEEQMRFIRQKDLGFDQNGVVVLHTNRDGSDVRFARLKERLKQKSFVREVSGNSALFDGLNGSVPVYPEGAQEALPKAVNVFGIKPDFLKLMNISILKGREFSELFPTDWQEGIVLNQSAAEMLGWKEPIGKKLRVGDIIDGRIIGVVNNFHFAPLHQEIEPLAIFISDLIQNIYIKVEPGNVQSQLKEIESEWKTAAPDQPFNFSFLDEHLAQMYENEKRFSGLMNVFTCLAMVIAMLGLYGIVAFVTQQKTKEIGIRKVLGASAGAIVRWIAKDFVVLVIAANVLALPAVHWAMDTWLQNFAYRIDLAWWMPALGGGMTLAIAIATVGFQTTRAAQANPVDALKYE